MIFWGGILSYPVVFLLERVGGGGGGGCVSV